MPRPAGRSGWVSTSAISNAVACKAASATRANSGVPAKAILIGGDALGLFTSLVAQLVRAPASAASP